MICVMQLDRAQVAGCVEQQGADTHTSLKTEDMWMGIFPNADSLTSRQARNRKR